MTVCALIAFWDEEPAMLDRAIRSCALAGVTHLVACDGAYALYPGGHTSSGHRAHKTIRRAARAHDLPLALYVPDRVWETEMEKRSFMFHLAHEHSPEGWWIVVDSDYELMEPRWPLPVLLDGVTDDVCTATLHTPPGPNGNATFGPPLHMSMRVLFRAQPGVTVQGNHYTYVTADGRHLWGNETTTKLQPAHDLTGDVHIQHWTYHRPKRRIGQQFDYYRARDAAGVELGPCQDCGQHLAVFMVPTQLRDLGDKLESLWLPVCGFCEPAALERAKAEAVALGADPRLAAVRVPLTVG